MRIERLQINGPAGTLEALLEFDPSTAPRLTALVCHPHPVYGGTMHNKVVFRAAKAALGLGLPALRFNFRGVGKSAGAFDGGRGELDDVRSALEFLRARFPGKPVILAGFSFGAWIGLAVGAREPAVYALVGLGLPVASWDFSFLVGVTKPKLIVQGTEDPYGPEDQLRRFFDSLDEPKQLRSIEGADHFFDGKLGEVEQAVREFIGDLLESR